MSSSDPLPSIVQKVKENTTLSEQAYKNIRRLILESYFAPGTVVSERLLAESLGMGKAPVRSALVRLAADGIVSIASRQGIVIKTLSLQDLLEMFQMRFALEAMVVRHLAETITAAQAEQLEANLQQQKTAAEAQQHADSIRLDFEYHQLLAEFNGNRQVHRVLSNIFDLLEREIRLAQNQYPERIRNSLREHREIYEALCAHDPEKAEDLMKKHLRFGEEVLISRNRR